jgi:hypothetical protein
MLEMPGLYCSFIEAVHGGDKPSRIIFFLAILNPQTIDTSARSLQKTRLELVIFEFY